MTYASWMPRYRVMTDTPGKLDLFVVTMIDGRRAALQPIDEYDAALAKARAFVSDHKCQVKVLPMTGPEVRNLLGIRPPDKPEPIDPALRRQMLDRLRRIARDSDDDARRDAFDLLNDMGAMQP
ncbi:hypothetical protein GVO57_10470 [Sphingomonas changnyeongensis]|uniref:Uncharacterized protein n=1 Tax=Sphingomonas changnyeongensis TaxID=2698679 RepID=A0A7Z2NWK3_9SPHN|nr:hypothetical protein [Sphingomonas changnyeongensis]QHL91163.1 hypothetical protein GVO57_10470 [Sphingomonas changnyeongensis]